MHNNVRQLAAIMFTDMVGYTALMQRSEKKAIQAREKHREIFNRTTSKYNGRILQYYGDGTLSIFNSVIDAVNCAAEMQKLFQLDPIVPVRIGIHVGDIIVAEDDVIGDAVNVASRIESLAKAGSVLVSDRVQMDIKNHRDIVTKSLGHYELKNVQKPVEVFALVNEGLVVPESEHMLNKCKLRENIPNNLPIPATRFFGRRKELQKIKELLANNRLVTLLGSGGCGKTRLAIETARETLSLFPDGTYFFGLAPVTNDELVAGTIAETLHINPEKERRIEETIANRISNKKMLLVVDNCEHLIDECARILNLLISRTEIPRILVTSREALNILGETIYRTPTLPVPGTTTKLSEIIGFDSVQLFQDRVLMNKPEFELNKYNSRLVSSICKQLAASRMKVMDPETILDRLSDQFRLLSVGTRTAPPHQQTLRATIDWSYNLLTEEEKILFHRLSVFTGDFDLDDAEKICGYDPLTEFQVLDLLTRLVDKSLVITNEREQTVRYSLLEVMKQYGLEKVTRNGDLSALQERYSNYYLDKVDLSYKERMKNSLKWSLWLSLELDNLQGALSILQDQPTQRLKLAGLLAEFFFLHANLSIGRKILSSTLEASTERNIDRARALCGLGFLEILINPDLGYKKMIEGIEIIQELDDKLAKMDIYWRYGAITSFYKKWEEAYQIMEEGLKIARERNDPWMENRYKNSIAWLAIARMKPELVEPEIEHNLEESIRLGNHYDIIDAHHIYADVMFLKGDYRQAEKLYKEAAENAQQLGSELQVSVLIHSMSLAVSGQGRHEKALRLFGASNAKLDELGAEIPAVESVNNRIDQTIGKSIQIMGDKKSQILKLEGRQMDFEQAVEYAFDIDKD
jgi:predicted ATPase/class 3 adenylate cyclase